MATPSKQQIRTPAKQTPGSNQRTRTRSEASWRSGSSPNRSSSSVQTSKSAHHVERERIHGQSNAQFSAPDPVNAQPHTEQESRFGFRSIIHRHGLLLGMSFSPVSFLTSPVQSYLHGSTRTPMSTPTRSRSDLGSVRRLRLMNGQDELVRRLRLIAMKSARLFTI